MTDKQLGEILVKIAETCYKLSDGKLLKSLDGDALSYVGVKLASMKAAVVDLKTVALEEMLRLEVELDAEKARAFVRAKKDNSATAAADMKHADPEFIEAKRKYNEAKVQYERLKSIVADAHDVIDAIKSRVIDLQTSRRDDTHR